VHVAVESVDDSVSFYSTLFAAPPTVLKPDYAKWLLEDPRVNFAISARGRHPGVSHLGIQAEDRTELAEIAARLRTAERPLFDEGPATCCYARSEKAWVHDPSGVSWETFLTVGESTIYGEESPKPEASRCACSSSDIQASDISPVPVE
jgi:hypothetical protein